MIKPLKSYESEDVLDFGKYEGYKVSEIYHFTPDYIEWCIQENDAFYTNLLELQKLPLPTPMRLVYFKIVGKWLSHIAPEKNQILEARKYLQEGNILEVEKFGFSDPAIKSFLRKTIILLKACRGDRNFDYSGGFDFSDFD